MVNICSEFGIEYNILYNEKKTVCTCYSRADKHVESFHIDLNWKLSPEVWDNSQTSGHLYDPHKLRCEDI